MIRGIRTVSSETSQDTSAIKSRVETINHLLSERYLEIPHRCQLLVRKRIRRIAKDLTISIRVLYNTVHHAAAGEYRASFG